MNEPGSSNMSKKLNAKSRADLATSWRVIDSNTCQEPTSPKMQNSSNQNGLSFLRSIWDDIPNFTSYHDERQGNSQPLVTERNPWALALADMLDLPPQTSCRLINPWGFLEPLNTQQDNGETNIDYFNFSNMSHNLDLIEQTNLETIENSSDINDILREKFNTFQPFRYLSESAFTPSLNGKPVFRLVPSSLPYTVLKIQNVPWYASSDSIKRYFAKEFKLPSSQTHPLSVHILMDRCSGKTLGTAFVEIISTSKDLENTLSKLEKSLFQGRRLNIRLSNYDHLREMLFFDYPGRFENGMAIPDTNDEGITESSALFVEQKHFQTIQHVCKHFKMCYNRKSPERPFEYLMSLIIHIPWLQSKAVITWQRDLIYESFKLTTETLKYHLSKPHHNIDSSLLSRFVRVALLCEGLSIKQKSTILKVSNLDCPDDLVTYITEDVSDDSVSTTV